MRKTAYVSALTAVAVLGGAATASAADPVTSKYLLNVTDGQVKARATPSTAFATSAAPVPVFGTRTTDADTPETATLDGFKVPATTVATAFTQTLTKGDPAVTTTLKSDVTLAPTTLHGTETLTGADKGKVALSGPATLVFKVSSTVGTAAATIATCKVTTTDLALASKPDVTTPGTGTGNTASGTYAGKARGTDNAIAINGKGASSVAADGADPNAICADLGTALGLTGTGADDQLAVRLAGTLAPRPLADYTGAFTSNSLQFGTTASAAVAATSIPFKTDGDTDALATLDATKAAFALPTGAFVVKLGATPADTLVTVALPTAADVTGNVNLKDGAKIAGKGDGLFYDTALPATVTPTFTFGAKQCAPAAPVNLKLVADRDEDDDVVLGADAAAQKDQALSQTDGTVAYTAGTTVTALKPVGTTATQAECDELAESYATTFGSDDLKLRLAGTLKPTPTAPPGGGTNDGGGILSLLPLLLPQPKPPAVTPPAPKPVAKVKAKPHVTAKTPSRVRRGRTVTVKVKVRNASKVGVGTKLRLKVTVPKGLMLSGSKKKTVGTLKAHKTKTITLKFRTSRSTKSTNRVRFSVSGTNASSAKGSVRIRVR